MNSTSRGLSIPDQAQRLRDLVGRRTRSALIVAVTSGKGGVGKSNVAVNLSICLAANSFKVALVDVDMGLANADLLLNIEPRHHLGHVLSGSLTMDEVAVEGPGGIRFVPGASGMPDWANLSDFELQNLNQQIRKLETNTDIVVLDCGAGISRNVISFARGADCVLVVTTPQPPALTDAYATIKALRRAECCARMGLFVNMVRSKSEAAATYRRLSGVAQRFLNYPIADLGYMLQDHTVELAVRARCPFVISHPGSNAGACIASLAGQLIRVLTGQENRGGFFKRVVGLFA